MFDASLLAERLDSVLEALQRIPRHLANVPSAEAFAQGDEGRDRLDAICMILIAVGEAFKQIDRKTDAPACDNCGAITVRNGNCYLCYNCGSSMGCSWVESTFLLL